MWKGEWIFWWDLTLGRRQVTSVCNLGFLYMLYTFRRQGLGKNMKGGKTSPQFSGFARVACWRRNVKLLIVTSRSNVCNKTISGHFIKTARHIYFPRSAR